MRDGIAARDLEDAAADDAAQFAGLFDIALQRLGGRLDRGVVEVAAGGATGAGASIARASPAGTPLAAPAAEGLNGANAGRPVWPPSACSRSRLQVAVMKPQASAGRVTSGVVRTVTALP